MKTKTREDVGPTKGGYFLSILDELMKISNERGFKYQAITTPMVMVPQSQQPSLLPRDDSDIQAENKEADSDTEASLERAEVLSATDESSEEQSISPGGNNEEENEDDDMEELEDDEEASLWTKALALLRSERYQEALVIHKRVLAIRMANREHNDQEIGDSFYAIGRCFLGLDQSHQAMSAFQEALDISKKVYGNESPRTVLLYHFMAVVCNGNGYYQISEQLYITALRIYIGAGKAMDSKAKKTRRLLVSSQECRKRKAIEVECRRSTRVRREVDRLGDWYYCSEEEESSGDEE